MGTKKVIKHKWLRPRNVLLSGTALTIAFCGTAFAQGAPSSGQNATIEVVTVTAERRAEDIQSAPIAISAFDSDQMTRAGLQTFDSLYKLVPNVRITRVVGLPVIAIRGVYPTDLSPTSEPKVSVALDGANVAKATGIPGMFFDLQRVEVLKGPQGTLYGRNAVGGAVNLITNKPTQNYSAHGELEVGDYNLFRGEAALNVPVSSTVAVRAAFQTYRTGGYYKNGLQDNGYQAGRLEMLWKPDDRQQLLLEADIERLNYKGAGPTNLVGVITPPYGPGNPNAYIPPPFNNNYFYGGDPPFYYRSNQFGLMAEYNYNFDFATLTVQLANRKQIEHDYGNQGNDPPGTSGHQVKYNSYTAEARLTSPSDQQLSWVAGLFLFEDKDTGFLKIYGGVLTPQQVNFDNPFERAWSYAGFGQATYTPDFNKKIHLTGGLRYTFDNKSAVVGTQFGSNPYPKIPGKGSWAHPTWRVALQYDIAPKSMIYGSISTGYKAGGFFLGKYARYDPEYITSYEAGSKNTFLNGRLQVNVEGFYYNYTNFEQVIAYQDQGVTVITATNAGQATLYGGSLSLVALLSENDRLAVDVAGTHGEYGKYDLRPINSQLSDLSHTLIPHVPPVTANLTYDHYWEAWGGNFDFQGSASLQTRTMMANFHTNTQYPVNIYQGSYARGDFSLRYAPDSSMWSITGYIRNISNDISYQSMGYGNSTGDVYATLMDPRTFGVILTADIQ